MGPISRRTALKGLALGTAATAGALGTPGTASAAEGQRADAHDAGAAVRWVRTANAVVTEQALTPPSAARVYALLSVASYEVLLPWMPGHRSLRRQVRDLPRSPRPVPANGMDLPMVLAGLQGELLRALLPDLTPTAAVAIEERERAEALARADAGVGLRRRTASLAHGRRVARVMAAWAATDGHAEALARPYTPTPGPDRWTPTPPNFGTAIEPYCADVRPMVLRTTDEVAPAPPVPYSEVPGSPFWQQAEAVVQQSLDNTDATRDIARYWTDNPRFSGLPAGHWTWIGAQIAEQQGLTLDRTVEVLARLGVALHDAFLNCWTWKYRYDLVRPVTYVNRHLDPAWKTWVNTPQFPEFTSGHSVASRAAATVLMDALGPVAFTDTTLSRTEGIVERSRSFADVDEAAAQAAQSRLYGGIHYPMGIEAGMAQGDRIGALVVARLRTRR